MEIKSKNELSSTNVPAVSNMYADAKTWSPFKGCKFDCIYCVPSFQKQAKRQMHNCMDCYNYIPHFHQDRLSKIPSSKIVFVCGNADISFADSAQLTQIIDAINDYNRKHPFADKTFYMQSKSPSCLEPFLGKLPKNVIILTTLETNRDNGYDKISKAPVPSERYRQLLALKYPRKVVTIEPLLDFDVEVFAEWIQNIKPEYVWLGFNSKDKPILPEPSPDKVKAFADILIKQGIPVKGKHLRGMDLPGVIKTQG